MVVKIAGFKEGLAFHFQIMMEYQWWFSSRQGVEDECDIIEQKFHDTSFAT